jgi:hypothetical protein
MSEGDMVETRRSFNYGGEDLDRGQVIELKGLTGDAALVRQERFVAFSENEQTFQCGTCGARFSSEGAREMHGNNRHSN